MFEPQSAAFIGKQNDDKFCGQISGNNFFLIIAIEGIDNKQGLQFLAIIKDNILNQDINKLTHLETFISEEITKANLPTSISLACGYINNDILYLRTLGEGIVFLYREKQLVKIINGENSASGYIQKNDTYVFTTNNFQDDIEGYKNFKKILSIQQPDLIVTDLNSHLEDFGGKELIALFVKICEPLEIANQVISNRFHKPNIFQNFSNIYQKIKYESDKSGKGKIITIGALILIFIVLIWSVILGGQRKQETEMQNKITQSKEIILHKLSQADEVSFINLSKSISLITEAKQEFEKLKHDLNGKKEKEITELDLLIKNKENSIVKKEEKNYEEFYDLAMDNKNASGVNLGLYQDELSILDKTNGVIYTLSLTKKSLEKYSDNSIKQASIHTIYSDNLFFILPQQGIYQIDLNNKIKKVIDNDKEWGNINNMLVYNANIYLLDKGKDEIYKYLVTDESYSNKKSYFGTGEAISLRQANSFAIDSSIYIGFTDYIKKFTAGVRDTFATSFPDTNVSLIKIFTNKDLDKVYAWDKTNARIYVLEKNGNYEKQINSSILKSASDFVIYEKAIYALVNSKIFKINID